MEYCILQITNCDELTTYRLQDKCFEQHSLGIVDYDNHFIAYFNETKDEVMRWVRELTSQFRFNYKITIQEEKNWNKLWESNYSPIRVNTFCRVCAPFHEMEEGFTHQVVINPQMAFGTGHHETTFLMIEALEKLNIKNKQLLDLGSGTGILAIIACKEDASHVTAVDIDRQSFVIMQDNFELNGCKMVKSINGTIEDVSNTFDIIVANINRNTLIDISKQLYNCMNKPGTLVLSGFYKHDCDRIVDVFRSVGFIKSRMATRNSWALLTFIK